MSSKANASVERLVGAYGPLRILEALSTSFSKLADNNEVSSAYRAAYLRGISLLNEAIAEFEKAS